MNVFKKQLLVNSTLIITLGISGYALSGEIKMASVANGDNSVMAQKSSDSLTMKPGDITLNLQCQNSDDFAFVAVYQQGLPIDVQFLENMKVMQPLSDSGNWESPKKGSATLIHQIDSGKYVAAFYCVDKPKGSYTANASIDIIVN